MALPTARSAANTNIGANKIEEKSEVDWKSQQQVSKPPASKVNIKYFMRSIFRDKKTSSEAFIVKEIKEEPSFNIKQSNKPRFSLCVGNPAIINEEVENKTSNKIGRAHV